MDSGGTGAQEGLRALQGPPSLGPGLMASFMLSILKLPDSLIPLLPSKTIARTTARTGSDKMSLMAGPEDLETEVEVGVISGAPPSSPKVPPLLPLCSWCVCPGSLPGTEHQPGSDSGQSWEQVPAFIVWGEGGASSLPSLGASPGTCLPVPTHLFLFYPLLVGTGVKWVTTRSLSLKPLAVHYPCRQISLLGDLGRS